MAFAIMSLMAQMFAPALIVYWAGLLLFRGKSLTRLTKIAGFFIALPCSAITALMLAPSPVSAASAEAMYWPGILIGCAIGVVLVVLIGKRKPATPSSS